MSRILQPADWIHPKGFSNGMTATGTHVVIAGQIGWNAAGEFVSDDFVEQAAQALRNIVAILHEAHGKPEHLVRLTWYVTDKREYLASGKELGKSYKAIVGPHYPAMTLVEVSGLLEDRAKVEIEATAVIPG